MANKRFLAGRFGLQFSCSFSRSFSSILGSGFYVCNRILGLFHTMSHICQCRLSETFSLFLLVIEHTMRFTTI